MSNSSIRLIDRTLSDAPPPGESEPATNGNEGVLHISQSSRFGTSPSDFLMSHPGHSLRDPYLSSEKQSVYSTVKAD